MPTRAELQTRALKATAMRLAGARYEDIAQALGYNSRQAAHDAVRRTLRDMPDESPEQVKRLEASRLDRMQQALWTQALSGNQGAVDRVLRIMERRSRLLGIDAPTQTQVQQVQQVEVYFADEHAGDVEAAPPGGNAHAGSDYP